MKPIEALKFIQDKLVAPKGQKNTFGNYKYRSCEDILEAVKPLLKETGTTLIIRDEIVQIGERYYVKAVAELAGGEDNFEAIYVAAFARECLVKKGMDEAQITGAASSYARKYALNGLFCIDDTKDADTQDNRTTDEPRKESTPSSNESEVVTMINVVVNKAKKKFKELDEFKVWRADNGLPENLYSVSDLELSKVVTALNALKDII